MSEEKDIIGCYNKTATSYAKKFMGELTHKHFDKLLLDAFALENAANGKFLDLGCGPGQTTQYLWSRDAVDIIGIDISPNMISVARSLNPQLHFEVADILSLPYAAGTFASAIAFYSIVHFGYEKLAPAFREIRRVLQANGHFLFSFHIGNDRVHMDVFLEEQVNIDFYFFEPARIIEILKETGFDIIDCIQRDPYQSVEYPSKRAYIWAKSQS